MPDKRRRSDPSAARTENGTANAHHRRSLLDRCFEIFAHAHRQVLEADLVAQLTQTAKVRTRVADWRNGHQSDEPNASDRMNLLHNTFHISRCDTALLRLVADVDLKQHIARRDFLRELDRVDRLDDVENAHGVFRLVRLQVADEVPTRAAVYERLLVARFLHAILADV